MDFHLKYLLLFAFCFLHFTDSEKYRCDYQYSHSSQMWFKYHDVPAVWTDARLMCAFEGAILASPINLNIKSTIIKAIRRTPIFTGLHATVSKGQYVTVEGIPLEELQYGWSEDVNVPEYYKGGCLALDCQGGFTNVDCFSPRPYICYRNSTGEPNVCGTTDSGYSLEQETNKCYKFHTVPRNYSRANFICQAEGGHLAIINDKTEAKVLRKLFASYPAIKIRGHFWKDVAFVGFHDWGEHGEWRTVHGQTLSEAGYDSFSPGEPTNSTEGEYCGSIYRTGLLNDLWCNKRFAFICEKRPNYPPLCDKLENSIAREGETTESNKNLPT